MLFTFSYWVGRMDEQNKKLIIPTKVNTHNFNMQLTCVYSYTQLPDQITFPPLY